MSLEQKIRKGKLSRRDFIKLGLGGIASLGLGLQACKNPVGPEPPEPAYYNIKVVNKDIFTNKNIGGKVILNNKSKPSGSIFSVENGQINTLNVKVQGYINAYILGEDSTGKVVYTRDEQGCHPTSIDHDTIIYTKLIPDDFDIVLFAKCAGPSIESGVIQRYADGKKERIKVKVCRDSLKGANLTDEIMNQVFKKVKEAINKFNTAGEPIVRGKLLGGIGDGSTDQLEDGLTVLIGEFGLDESPMHGEWLHDNIIYKSVALLQPEHILISPYANTLLEEITQALSGLRNDGGYPNFPYTHLGMYVNDGVRAIRLNNLLPPGFRLSTQGIPEVIVQEHPTKYRYDQPIQEPDYKPGLFPNPLRNRNLRPPRKQKRKK